VPLREGGFAHHFAAPGVEMSAGVACLPPGGTSAACYTFEIPPDLPVGFYGIEAAPLEAGNLDWPSAAAVRWPFLIEVRPSRPFKLPAARRYLDLYPFDYKSAPLVWDGARSVGAMTLTGYTLIDNERHLFSCPGSPPGVYELTIRGESEPVSSPDHPEDLWPEVMVMLPGVSPAPGQPADPRPAGRVALRSRSARTFRVQFTALEPFNSLMLQAQLPPAGDVEPQWLLFFNPASYGRPRITLREARLQLRRPLFPD
jgi:hypothetical protein